MKKKTHGVMIIAAFAALASACDAGVGGGTQNILGETPPECPDITVKHGGGIDAGVQCPPPPPPPSGCTLTQGYWKNHPEAWPVDSLVIGGRMYTKAELLALLNTPPRGDASLILVHQLIAAMLNVESGATPAPAAIAQANALLAGYPALPLATRLAPSSVVGQMATALADALAAFNEGVTGPGHCDEQNNVNGHVD